ncbi:MAG: hypothetical protein M1825_002114 [Sarcosagium campestre]|nr:MAG: hypothetical protein M1825_002114 [Sarcosagium campestre]
MGSTAKSLESLLKQATLEDHEDVLKAANAKLKKSKTDLDVLHVKVVALLKLDRYEDALHVLESGGDKLKARAQLETAYALYKIGEWREADNIARNGADERGLRHVEAQAKYRLEEFQGAARIYKELVSQPAEAEDEENDLRINGGAVEAQLEWAGQGHAVERKKLGSEDLSAFETTYNAACSSIARGELRQAEVLLKRSKDLCNALTDLSEEEKQAELLPIATQQIYVLKSLGKDAEAEKLSSELPIDRISEQPTQLIAQTNTIASSPRLENPYLAQRDLQPATAQSKSAQPFEFQARSLRSNAYALELACLKYAGVASSTAKFLSKNQSPTLSPGINAVAVINAAAQADSQTGKEGLKQILPLLEKRPKDVGLLLTIVQLYMFTNNHGTAISLFESFLKRLEQSTTLTDQDVRYAPGLVAILVELYKRQCRKAQTRNELTKAASYWRKRSKAHLNLLRAAGVALLDSPKTEDHTAASDFFEQLKGESPSDRTAIAGFVAANAVVSPQKCATDVDSLTEVSRLTSGIDAAALEEAGVPSASSILPATTGKKRARADEAAKPAKKRVRKSRIPNDIDPNKPADPERWIPLRDRSTYRPKGRKAKQKASTLTQGGVTSAATAEKLGGAETLKLEKAGAEGVSKTQQQPQQSQNKKKKAKGGKR